MKDNSQQNEASLVLPYVPPLIFSIVCPIAVRGKRLKVSTGMFWHDSLC